MIAASADNSFARRWFAPHLAGKIVFVYRWHGPAGTADAGAGSESPQNNSGLDGSNLEDSRVSSKGNPGKIRRCRAQGRSGQHAGRSLGGGPQAIRSEERRVGKECR